MTPEPTLNPVQTPSPNEEEKIWALVAHLSGLFSGFVIPLIILVVKGKESPWVRAQTIEALNFHLTITVGVLISIPLMVAFVGFCLAIGLAIYSLIFTIIAAVRSYNGEAYRYPVTVRLLS